MKRTTIRLPDAVMKRAKRLAASTGKTFAAVVEDALQAVLIAHESPKRSKPIRLVTFRGDGLCRGVNLDNSADLRDLMDGLIAPR